MNIYIGNLSEETSEKDLRNTFEAYGEVSTVNIIKDRYTNKAKGFAFVEMPAKTEGQTAIEKLNGTEIMDQNIIVNEARPRGNRSGNRGNNNRGYGNKGFGGGKRRY